MLARPKKSAIAVTSSFVSLKPFPCVAVPSASKRLSAYLCEALSYELQDRIDVLAWKCGMTASRMVNGGASGKVASIEEAVDGGLNSLGHERLSYGCTRHDFFSSWIDRMPDWYILPKISNDLRIAT